MLSASCTLRGRHHTIGRFQKKSFFVSLISQAQAQSNSFLLFLQNVTNQFLSVRGILCYRWHIRIGWTTGYCNPFIAVRHLPFHRLIKSGVTPTKKHECDCQKYFTHLITLDWPLTLYAAHLFLFSGNVTSVAPFNRLQVK